MCCAVSGAVPVSVGCGAVSEDFLVGGGLDDEASGIILRAFIIVIIIYTLSSV